MLPVTVHQLMDVEQQGDSYYINGREVHQVTFVGRIVNVQESATNVLYKIYDNTADPFEVRKWIDSDDSTADIDKRSECREGVIVRVFGHLRSFQGQKSVVAFAVNPITDFDEITFHMLDTVHAHLALKKASSTSTTSIPSADMNSHGASTESYSYARSGMTPVQSSVYQSILQCRDEAGIFITDLLAQCKQKHMRDADVRQAVEFLSNEGHVYSTIDDDHYKATES
jgi:replication factor A2